MRVLVCGLVLVLAGCGSQPIENKSSLKIGKIGKIGAWCHEIIPDNPEADHIIEIERKADGTISLNQVLDDSIESDPLRYERGEYHRDNVHGEYYIITEDGRLQFLNLKGHFRSALPVPIGKYGKTSNCRALTQKLDVNLIGLWCDGRDGMDPKLDHIIEIKRLADGTYLQSKIRGESLETRTESIPVTRQDALFRTENTYGDYAWIEPDGNLQLHNSKDGLFGIAKAVTSYDIPNQCRSQ